MLELHAEEVRQLIKSCVTVRHLRRKALRKDIRAGWVPPKGKRNANEVAIDRLDAIIEKLNIELELISSQFDSTEYA